MAQKKQKRVKAKTPRSMQTPDYAKQIKRAYTTPKAIKMTRERLYTAQDLKKFKVGKMAKRAPTKSLARKVLGKAAKSIPGVAAAVGVHDVMRAGAKKGCIKRGGKWVSGKCQIAKKPRTKASGPDPRFAKSRSKK